MKQSMSFARLATLAAGLLLAGCAVHRPPAEVPAPTPPQWYAPLPHGGKLADLRQWWRQFDDPLLVDLIDAAEASSSSLASAKARIAEARATRTGARAALLPELDANASWLRGNAETGIPLSTITEAGVAASWEIDLFGGNRAALDAAAARLQGAEAGWYDSRVSVAAETANAYVELRACQRLLEVQRNDAASRAETARLTELSAQAGFTAPAVAAQARASASDGASRSRQQEGQCELDVKSLVALTGLAEPDLRARLAATPPGPVEIEAPPVPALPAALLAQRPDVFQAERAVEAASADVGNARAQRFPRLTLAGQLNTGTITIDGVSTSGQTWQIGPVALTVPIFDAGRRAANEQASQARYDEAVSLYAARVRQAVSEVEKALVQLASADARNQDAVDAVTGYRTSFTATEAQYRSGLSNLIELEDQRRVLLAAEISLVGLQQERFNAWIALYRALGGGWETGDTLATAPTPKQAEQQ